jgi:hypothetical protein
MIGTHELSKTTSVYAGVARVNNNGASGFAAYGAGGANLNTLQSTTSGTQFTLSKASGTVSRDYLSIKDSNATGGATWDAGANSTNVSNNTGWIFTAPPVPSATNSNFLQFF